ncbi:Bacteriophage Gp15 protein [Clostridium cavendishii DSM 21758]|uniref:Bacteriophage Gp15 protein n=1 Tax=Clostridium cavendishii DSM 21758 TaxID=1121302 RepID=A0A1M6HSL9_9CLOT|nr:bacteriophage Gp15 family protein [Clostridium cavendishii]SHJ25173.1 Bacteriophage Gp15 protein [Clostridium cavendishii DSM 21758]
MNILIDLLPRQVNIDGIDYDINSDFRTSILFEMMVQDNDIGNKEKIVQALELYYPVIPENLQEAIEKIIWFYGCGKEVEKGKGGEGSNKAKQIYSFEYDDDYIYAAFLNQYGIDLQEIEDLHWWKFKAMFKALKEDNEIVKIMGYRAMTIPMDMPKDQKDFYRKMKKLHEIPRSKSEREKINAIEEALMGNGILHDI